MLVLLGHASAGERLESPTRDGERRLDGSGWVAARRLVDSLGAYSFERLLSSPLPRCVETVSPLAQSLGREIEVRDDLAPGAPLDAVGSLLDELVGISALVCTHREIFETLFDGEVVCEKAGAWVVHAERRRRLTAARYLPPPLGTPLASLSLTR